MNSEKEHKSKGMLSRAFQLDQTPSIDVLKMDEFVQNLYEFALTLREDFQKNILSYFNDNGEFLMNIRDSTGNYLIHHLCFIFKDEDAEVFANIIRCLIGYGDEWVKV